ncbi:MAG: hypothetical protein NVS4B11_09770 [Ktedonobacteraceae bacterium]
MRISQQLTTTLREAPRDTEGGNQELLVRAGFIRQLTTDVAEKLYQDMQSAYIEVLLDDRDERAGVKFNDADLIGLPIRVVISKRSLKNGGIEMKLRTQKESRIVSLADVITTIQEEINKGLGI